MNVGMKITNLSLTWNLGAEHIACGAFPACSCCLFMPRKPPVLFALSSQVVLWPYLTGFSLQCLKKGVQ